MRILVVTTTFNNSLEVIAFLPRATPFASILYSRLALSHFGKNRSYTDINYTS